MDEQKRQEFIDAMQQKLAQKTPTQGACPHCGYCPHCGRSGNVLVPYYQPQPYWQWYPNTAPYYGTTISVTSGGNGGTVSLPQLTVNS